MPAAQRRRSFRFVSPQSNQRRRIKHGRRLLFESLEARRLLAVDWRNPVNSLDISGDGFISPVDPLQVINELNLAGPHALAAQRPAANPFWDANGDQFISPVDALQVINALNASQTVPYSLGEGQQIANEQSVAITVGQAAGTRTYRLEVTPIWNSAFATQSGSQDSVRDLSGRSSTTRRHVTRSWRAGHRFVFLVGDGGRIRDGEGTLGWTSRRD